MEDIHPPPHPPKDFDRVKATNPDLVKYGLPPRPPPGSDQSIRDRWLYNMSQPLHYVYPSFHVKKPLPTISASGVFCGAILNPPPGRKFMAVCANWTVPNVYPPESARNGDKLWKDGVYSRFVTVGLDGAGENACDVVVGTTSEVEVSGGQIVRQDAYARVQYPMKGLDLEITTLKIKPGDFICVRVHLDPTSNTKATAIVLNETAGEYTSLLHDITGGLHFGGGPARWGIQDVGDPVDYKYGAFAKFGTIHLVEPVAVSPIDNVMRAFALQDATVINMKHDEKVACSAIKITPDLLRIR